MRGTDKISGSLFSYVDIEERIPARHPLRQVKRIVDDALSSLDAEFGRLYAAEGRPSIAPERLMRASLIQILFSVRSERQLMEQMQYNLLFRWFVGLGIDDPVWVPTVFTKNRDRLLTTDMSRKFLAAVLAHRDVAPLLSDEHFSVDGTLIKAWASMKSFQPRPTDAPPDDGAPSNPPAAAAPGPDADQPARQDPQTAEQTDPESTPEAATETVPMPKPDRRDRNADVDFCGERRSNATHVSTTDPDARLFRKSRGTGAILCFMGHTLMENRWSDCAGRADPRRRPCRTPRCARDDPPPLARIDTPADAWGRQGLRQRRLRRRTAPGLRHSPCRPEGARHRHRRPHDPASYGRFWVTEPVRRRADWRLRCRQRRR